MGLRDFGLGDLGLGDFEYAAQRLEGVKTKPSVDVRDNETIG